MFVNPFPNWWILVSFLAEIGSYSTNEPNGMIGRLNGFPRRLLCGVFPSDKRSWTFRRLGVFWVIRPNTILHFAPFLSTHFFPWLNPMFKNGSFLSVVAHTFRFESSPSPWKKDRFGHRLPPSPADHDNWPSRMSRTKRGTQHSPCFWESRAFPRTRYAHLWCFNHPFHWKLTAAGRQQKASWGCSGRCSGGCSGWCSKCSVRGGV